MPGRHLAGVHLAMEYLKPSNLVREGVLATSPITAHAKHVVIIGGGDTGADCLGTAHRQGALSVHQLEILPRPPEVRPTDNPWPTWPLVFRTSSAHEEGGERLYAVTTDEFVDDGAGAVHGLRGHRVQMVDDNGRPAFEAVEDSGFELPCDLVLLAMGFLGAERQGVVAELGLELDPTRRGGLRPPLGHEPPGRVRVRRHDPWPEPDRVGHRRRAVVRGERGPVADGGERPARPPRARAAGPALSTRASRHSDADRGVGAVAAKAWRKAVSERGNCPSRRSWDPSDTSNSK